MVFVAVGDGVGTEWDRCGVGVCAGALPMGACDPSPLTQICVLLEAPQAGRPASVQGEFEYWGFYVG